MRKRARQYGNTTTIDALCKALQEDNIVLSLDFQDISKAVFDTEGSFVQGMARIICDTHDFQSVQIPETVYGELEVIGPLEEKFKEKDGREQFLLYLKPIINGTGNYYIEAQTRDQTRTDVIVDYLGQQYIIELKIWRGPRYNAEGEKQIIEYLDHYGLSTGYMLSFNFNKNKQPGVHPVHIDDKLLYEGTV